MQPQPSLPSTDSRISFNDSNYLRQLQTRLSKQTLHLGVMNASLHDLRLMDIIKKVVEIGMFIPNQVSSAKRLSELISILTGDSLSLADDLCREAADLEECATRVYKFPYCSENGSEEMKRKGKHLLAFSFMKEELACKLRSSLVHEVAITRGELLRLVREYGRAERQPYVGSVATDIVCTLGVPSDKMLADCPPTDTASPTFISELDYSQRSRHWPIPTEKESFPRLLSQELYLRDINIGLYDPRITAVIGSLENINMLMSNCVSSPKRLSELMASLISALSGLLDELCCEAVDLEKLAEQKYRDGYRLGHDGRGIKKEAKYLMFSSCIKEELVRYLRISLIPETIAVRGELMAVALQVEEEPKAPDIDIMANAMVSPLSALDEMLVAGPTTYTDHSTSYLERSGSISELDWFQNSSHGSTPKGEKSLWNWFD